MNSVIFVGLNQPLQFTQRAEPVPASEEVIVEVSRCGICGSDLHMSKDPAYGAKYGDVFGHEFAGTVMSRGANVTRLRKGDRVSILPIKSCGRCSACLAGEPAWCAEMRLQGGGYAELAAVAERQCVKLPSAFSLEDGAIAEPLAVALHGIQMARVQAADRILVIGAGPIGLSVAFWARRMGASSVVVQDLTDTNRNRALAIGASVFITANPDPVMASEEALGGKADIVFDCVGAPGLLMQAVTQVRVKGKIVILGLCTKPDSINWFSIVQKEVSILTSAFFKLSEYQATLDTLESSAFQPRDMVSASISLQETPRIFEELKTPSRHCKVLISAEHPLHISGDATASELDI